jgi:peroxiredoxin
VKVGDLAPDFRLKRYDNSSWVQLAGFRADRPVVLIFGSYT